MSIERKCRGCGEQIHPMRLDVLPNTKTCVKCSKEGKKAGRFSVSREGEDISTQLEIHDPEKYQEIVKIEKQYG